MGELLRRLSYLVNRRRHDKELAEELEFHREMTARGGGRLGNELLLREESREAWGWTWIDRLSQDVRFAARLLRKSPWFTLSAVLMLAAGIGVNVAAFTFFNLVVLRPLPIPDPDSLLRFHRSAPEHYWSDMPFPAMAFYRDHSRTLSAVLALQTSRLTMEGDETLVSAQFVTSNYHRQLGATPRYGRLLDPARDDIAGSEPVVVLGHAYWERRFGSDPSIAGRVIRLNGKSAVVAGVAAREFSGLTMSQPDLWTSITHKPYFVSGSKLFTDFEANGGGIDMWGRLRPGVSAKVAEDELQMLAAELRKQQPTAIWENERLTSEPGGYAQNAGGLQRGNSAPASFHAKLFPIFAMIGTLAFLILAIACANLGSLLLARGSAREREIAIRISVGAGGGRLIRQLLTESVLLALIGSFAGLALGWVVLRAMMVWNDAPGWLDLTPDWKVAAFAVGAGLAAAILFGLAPAMQIARQRFAATTMRQFLIAAQVASSCVLLIVAGLLVRALDRAITANLGFEFEQVVSINPRLMSHGYAASAARTYLDTIKSRLEALPGIESVALSASPPLGGSRSTVSIENNGSSIEASMHYVDNNFLTTMKIPLLRGRTLAAGEARAVVISDAVARFRWPSEDPLGKELAMGDARLIVVGVTANARLLAVESAETADIYQLYDESNPAGMVVLAKASGPPEGLASYVASIAKSIDPAVIPEVQTLKGSYKRKVENAQRAAAAVSLMGLVSLVLACLGIVGLVAYSVSRRTREIGIRMALGAKHGHVLASILRRFARPIAVGLIIGAFAAGGLSQLLRQQLHGLSNLDPIAYLAAIGTFALAALLAALVPAQRALRVNPMTALRND